MENFKNKHVMIRSRIDYLEFIIDFGVSRKPTLFIELEHNLEVSSLVMSHNDNINIIKDAEKSIKHMYGFRNGEKVKDITIDKDFINITYDNGYVTSINQLNRLM